MSNCTTYTNSFESKVIEFIKAGLIKSFPTKKEALEHAKPYGWNSAIKIEKRFETIWIIAKKRFGETIGMIGTTQDYRCPELRWCRDENNNQYVPVQTIAVILK